MGGVPGLSGAAILGDGSVALIVDVAALLAQAIRDNTTVAEARTRHVRPGWTAQAA